MPQKEQYDEHRMLVLLTTILFVLKVYVNVMILRGRIKKVAVKVPVKVPVKVTIKVPVKVTVKNMIIFGVKLRSTGIQKKIDQPG